MKKFRFRLQKVLEFRTAMEHWAQEAYLDTRVARLEAEAALLEVQNRRTAILQQPADSLDARRNLEQSIQVMDDEERAKQTVIEVLSAEEAKALELWHEKKQELETIVKLRDKAFDEWLLEENKREQADLDEWAVTRRSA